MSDLPFVPAAARLADRLLRATDVEGRIPRALQALGPLRDRDVVLLDRAPRLRERQLLELGARLTVVDRGTGRRAPRRGARPAPIAPSPGGPSAAAGGAGDRPASAGGAGDRPEPAAVSIVTGSPAATGLPHESADAVVAFWSAMAAPCPDELAEADRILRPGGRLLVVQDYGRDDLEPLRGAAAAKELVRWSRRDGWYLGNGFRIHVIHTFWRFATTDEAAAILGAAFPDGGDAVVARLRRPRVAYNVAVYHRGRGSLDRPGSGA